MCCGFTALTARALMTGQKNACREANPLTIPTACHAGGEGAVRWLLSIVLIQVMHDSIDRGEPTRVSVLPAAGGAGRQRSSAASPHQSRILTVCDVGAAVEPVIQKSKKMTLKRDKKAPKTTKVRLICLAIFQIYISRGTSSK